MAQKLCHHKNSVKHLSDWIMNLRKRWWKQVGPHPPRFLSNILTRLSFLNLVCERLSCFLCVSPSEWFLLWLSTLSFSSEVVAHNQACSTKEVFSTPTPTKAMWGVWGGRWGEAGAEEGLARQPLRVQWGLRWHQDSLSETPKQSTFDLGSEDAKAAG